MGQNSAALQNPRSTGGLTPGSTAKYREVQAGQHFAVLQNTDKYRWVNTLRHCTIYRVGWINISRPMQRHRKVYTGTGGQQSTAHAYVTAKCTEVQTVTIHGQCMRHRKAYRGTGGQQSTAHAHVIARYTELPVGQQSTAYAYVTARYTEIQVGQHPPPMPQGIQVDHSHCTEVQVSQQFTAHAAALQYTRRSIWFHNSQPPHE